MFARSKKTINLVIEDEVIRILGMTGKSLEAIKWMYERPLPAGCIQNGKIVDEIGFYEFMKELVKELAIKNQRVRFYVPNALVIMREIEFPATLPEKEVKNYIKGEFEQSIHLPFKDPVFDIHYKAANDENFSSSLEETEEMQTATMFAASKEEVVKYAEIFADASLKPIAADVEALGVYRYFHYMQEVKQDDIYLFIQLNITSITLSIFHNHCLEFNRFQELDLRIKDASVGAEGKGITWKYHEEEVRRIGVLQDQLTEIERVMNFYRFSLNKGEKAVNHLVVLGDHPLVERFHDKLKNQFDLPVDLLRGYISKLKDEEIGIQFIPALGLALKGGVNNAS